MLLMFKLTQLKILVTFSFILLFTLNTKAADTLYFAGHIKVSKKVSYKYNLRFVISKDNKIVGYSLSDPGGPNETKTKITGTFDSTKMEMNYEEKNVLRSSVDLNKNDLCFVKASLKFKKTKLVETLAGDYSAFEPGKTEPCAKGTIKLVNTDKVRVILREMNNAPKEPEAKPTVEQPKKDKVEEIPKKDKVVEITDAKGKEFAITGTKIRLTIWDNGKADDDRISIMLNDKYVLENYTITVAPKVIELLLTNEERNTLKIIALSEGTLPPNTASIKINSEVEEYPIITQAKLNEVRTIYLRKKK
jgi:hypothetical protein